MSEIVWIDDCAGCLQGRVRPMMTRAGVIVSSCDECDLTWWRPDDLDLEKAFDPQAPDWVVVGLVDVVPGTTRWATLEEARAEWPSVQFLSLPDEISNLDRY